MNKGRRNLVDFSHVVPYAALHKGWRGARISGQTNGKTMMAAILEAVPMVIDLNPDASDGLSLPSTRNCCCVRCGVFRIAGTSRIFRLNCTSDLYEKAKSHHDTAINAKEAA
jgi:hypothetical protein